jgi:hypothetical protein
MLLDRFSELFYRQQQAPLSGSARGQIISPAIRSAVAMKARLGTVGAELVTEELAAWSAPRLQFAVPDWYWLDAERTTCNCAVVVDVCAHQVAPGGK